jgi:hypothetical protein
MSQTMPLQIASVSGVAVGVQQAISPDHYGLQVALLKVFLLVLRASRRSWGGIAEPLEDPACGVPLLPHGLLVALVYPVDDGEKGIALGPGSWCRAAVAGRLGVVEVPR